MSPLVDAVRQLVVQSLRLMREPETLDPELDLFGEELGLDSVDAVQLVASIEKHFDIQLSDADLANHPFTSIRAIVSLLEHRGVELENPPSGGANRAP